MLSTPIIYSSGASSLQELLSEQTHVGAHPHTLEVLMSFLGCVVDKQTPIFSWQSQFLTIFDPLFLGPLPSEAQGLITGTHN